MILIWEKAKNKFLADSNIQIFKLNTKAVNVLLEIFRSPSKGYDEPIKFSFYNNVKSQEDHEAFIKIAKKLYNDLSFRTKHIYKLDNKTRDKNDIIQKEKELILR